MKDLFVLSLTLTFLSKAATFHSIQTGSQTNPGPESGCTWRSQEATDSNSGTARGLANAGKGHGNSSGRPPGGRAGGGTLPGSRQQLAVVQVFQSAASPAAFIRWLRQAFLSPDQHRAWHRRHSGSLRGINSPHVPTGTFQATTYPRGEAGLPQAPRGSPFKDSVL